jgi:hypothetical protein
MSYNIKLFVDSNAEPEEFARELESLLGVELQLRSDEYDSWYELNDPRVLLLLGEHSHEDFDDLKLDQYRYEILMWVKGGNISTEQQLQEWVANVAYPIFRKLKASKKYPLLLLDDSFKKIEEYGSEIARNLHG